MMSCNRKNGKTYGNKDFSKWLSAVPRDERKDLFKQVLARCGLKGEAAHKALAKLKTRTVVIVRRLDAVKGTKDAFRPRLCAANKESIKSARDRKHSDPKAVRKLGMPSKSLSSTSKSVSSASKPISSASKSVSSASKCVSSASKPVSSASKSVSSASNSVSSASKSVSSASKTVSLTSMSVSFASESVSTSKSVSTPNSISTSKSISSTTKSDSCSSKSVSNSKSLSSTSKSLSSTSKSLSSTSKSLSSTSKSVSFTSKSVSSVSESVSNLASVCSASKSVSFALKSVSSDTKSKERRRHHHHRSSSSKSSSKSSSRPDSSRRSADLEGRKVLAIKQEVLEHDRRRPRPSGGGSDVSSDGRSRSRVAPATVENAERLDGTSARSRVHCWKRSLANMPHSIILKSGPYDVCVGCPSAPTSSAPPVPNPASSELVAQPDGIQQVSAHDLPCHSSHPSSRSPVVPFLPPVSDGLPDLIPTTSSAPSTSTSSDVLICRDEDKFPLATSTLNDSHHPSSPVNASSHVSPPHPIPIADILSLDTILSPLDLPVTPLRSPLDIAMIAFPPPEDLHDVPLPSDPSVTRLSALSDLFATPQPPPSDLPVTLSPPTSDLPVTPLPPPSDVPLASHLPSDISSAADVQMVADATTDTSLTKSSSGVDLNSYGPKVSVHFTLTDAARCIYGTEMELAKLGKRLNESQKHTVESRLPSVVEALQKCLLELKKNGVFLMACLSSVHVASQGPSALDELLKQINLNTSLTLYRRERLQIVVNILQALSSAISDPKQLYHIFLTEIFKTLA